jgi:hypothetical protein
MFSLDALSALPTANKLTVPPMNIPDIMPAAWWTSKIELLNNQPAMTDAIMTAIIKDRNEMMVSFDCFIQDRMSDE